MTIPAQPSMPPEKKPAEQPGISLPPRDPEPAPEDDPEPDAPRAPEKEIGAPPSAAYVNTGHAPGGNSGH